jgi:hypothetical protein
MFEGNDYELDIADTDLYIATFWLFEKLIKEGLDAKVIASGIINLSNGVEIFVSTNAQQEIISAINSYAVYLLVGQLDNHKGYGLSFWTILDENKNSITFNQMIGKY